MPNIPKKEFYVLQDLVTSGWDDYELLDSGDQKKLERFGHYQLVRFEPEAIWKPALDNDAWSKADAVFSIEKGMQQGLWRVNQKIPDSWIINFEEVNINVFISKSRHIGIFPEQTSNWKWIEKIISNEKEPPIVLNLFGYTGVSTVVAANAGATVTHVDASKNSITWAKKNLLDSGLENNPARWIVDDTYKFIEREIRRGNKYDAIILDPPKFGRGPGGEIWKFDKAIIELLRACSQVLSDHPLFVIITAYNVDVQPVELAKILNTALKDQPGKLQYGSLIQQEKSAGRKIRQSIYTRWEKIQRTKEK